MVLFQYTLLDGLKKVFLRMARQMNSKTARCLKPVLEANFYMSVIVMLAICLASITGSYPVFMLNEELYGPLANNFRIMLLYLAISEAIVCGYCFITKKFHIVMVVGFFLILVMGSLTFYGTINNLEVDPNLFLFFLYTGLSHILFGIMVPLGKNIKIHP
jgi:hypothetical protein